MTSRCFVACGLLVAAIALAPVSCNRRPPQPTLVEEEWSPPETLSAFQLFAGDPKRQQPAPGVVPYDLNTPLFSDYAHKRRFVKLPAAAVVQYHETEAFEFPVGTVLAKTFSYVNDARKPAEGERLIETRILLHRPEGWVGLPYVWNAEQTEATLDVAGGTTAVNWLDQSGSLRSVDYIVPNTNQCKSCHALDKANRPIGPKARHLNRDFTYSDGVENQLDRWTRMGMLNRPPASSQAPRAAVWDDPKSGSLDQRAMAWLDINCAHCHRPGGGAAQSGLDLTSSQTDWTKRGVWKLPVAAGRGSGGRAHDIVPGNPDASILVFRMESTEPGIMMPELPRRLVDREGVALIRQWIKEMPDPRR